MRRKEEADKVMREKNVAESREEGGNGGKEGVLFMPPPVAEVFRRKSTTPGCV